MISHTRTILRPPTSHKHHTMLLDIMSLARNIRRDDRPRRKLHTRRLALAGIGLLRPHDAHAQTDALQGRAVRVGQRGGDGVARSLALSDAAQDLVEGGLRGGSC